jgi:hypothetical protein
MITRFTEDANRRFHLVLSHSDIEIGHRSTSVAQLGNIAYRTKSHILWDTKAEELKGNKQASKLLSAKYRKPWKLTV